MSIDVKEIVETDHRTDLGEPIFSHIIQRDSDESAAARILRARIEGTPVTAICGHTWVPSRDPKKHPVCPKCLELFEMAKDLL